jgi:hypothetical protein
VDLLFIAVRGSKNKLEAVPQHTIEGSGGGDV